jgi:hypothetical protein
MATKQPTKRPIAFSQAVFNRICEQMAEGKSLRQICRAADMPDRRSVQRWLADDEKLQAQYNEAMSLRADHYFDEIIDIADGKGDPQKTRVQIDARKWVLACMNPKKYGSKVTHAGDPDAPVALVLKGSDVHG